MPIAAKPFKRLKSFTIHRTCRLLRIDFVTACRLIVEGRLNTIHRRSTQITEDSILNYLLSSKKFLSIRSAAWSIGVDAATIRNWIRSGKIKKNQSGIAVSDIKRIRKWIDTGVTVSDYAKLKKISTRQAYLLIHSGKINTIRKVSGPQRVIKIYRNTKLRRG